jgi:hypothetical protein
LFEDFLGQGSSMYAIGGQDSEGGGFGDDGGGG